MHFSFRILAALMFFGTKLFAGAIEEKQVHIDSIIKIATETYYTDPSYAGKLTDEAIVLSLEINYNAGLSSSYKIKGATAWHQGDLGSALEFFYESKRYAELEKDPKIIAASLSNIGLIYIELGSYEKALQFLFNAESLLRNHSETSVYPSILVNIGLAYERLGNDEKALHYYLKAYENDNSSDKGGVTISLNNIGWQYFKLDSIDLAMSYYQKALTLALEIENYYAASMVSNNLALIYHLRNEPEKALEVYDSSLVYARKIDHKEQEAIAIAGIGETYYQFLNRKEEGVKLIEESLQLLKSIGIKHREIESLKRLSEIYQLEGDCERSLHYSNLYVALKDSLIDEVQSRTIAEMAIIHEVEGKQEEIEWLNEKAGLKDQTLGQQSKIIYGVCGCIILLFFVTLLLFKQNKLKHQTNVKITAAHLALEGKNKEITDSINYAKRIQAAILPSDKLIKKLLPESFVLYKPKDIVAGDFYWLQKKDDTILIAAADCTGHGVPGAMVSVVCVNGLNRSVREHGITEPGKILDKTREIVIAEFEKSEEEVKDGMDISLCSISPLPNSLQEGPGVRLQWAGANNPLWIIRKNNEGVHEFIEVKPNKQPIGKVDNQQPFTTHKIELQKGDSVYIFTDGLQDQFGGEKGKKFKAANFKNLLLSIQNESMERQREIIAESFENWKASLEQVDDVCIIGVKI